MNKYKIEIARDKKQLSELSSQLIAEKIKDILVYKERAQIALCGGSTPFSTYVLLGSKNIPWNRVDIFLGDERFVDRNNSDSNSYMLDKSLFLDGKYSQSANFYPIPTTENRFPEESATSYSTIVKNNLTGNPPSFDLILLGLGDDGHTASLFPNSSALLVKDQLITVGEGKGMKRITFTPLLLNAAKNIFFLVSGSSKQVALKRLIDPMESWERTPAKLIKPKSDVIVLADKDSALLI